MFYIRNYYPVRYVEMNGKIFNRTRIEPTTKLVVVSSSSSPDRSRIPILYIRNYVLE